MIVLVDNTVLSNFALVERPELLRQALGEKGAVPVQVVEEFRTGVERQRLPAVDLGWLPVLTHSSAEGETFRQLLRHLNVGEAACLAIAAHRPARILTDDRDARALAGQMGIAVSGTLGVLIHLVRTEYLSLEQADHLLRQMIDHGYWSPVEKLKELL